MTGHNRRDGYWKYYDESRKKEPEFFRRILLEAIRANPHPTPEGTRRGRRPVHSPEKMIFLCLLAVGTDQTFRDVPDELRCMPKEWEGQAYPTHNWICRYMQRIDPDWLDHIMKITARMCMDELKKSADIQNEEITITNKSEGSAGGGSSAAAAEADNDSGSDGGSVPTAPLAADSSGVETTRYEEVERPNLAQQDFVKTRIKIYKKWHIAAITGHQIVLAAHCTSSNVSDTVMLPGMVDAIARDYPELAGRIFNADRGYDSDLNCKKIFDAGMIPNIKQRGPAAGTDATNRGKPSRKKAAEIYDEDAYLQRSMIEGIFRAEETRGHRLHCRMRLPKNRVRFGKILAIAWNIRVLNRFECAHEKGIKIPSYG